MKAAYHTEFGPPSVMKVGEREKPVPGPREVLVRVHASSVNKADFYRVAGSPGIVRLFSGAFFGPPKSIPGHDFAGVVEAVGSDLREYAVGDRVFGEWGSGAWAQYIAVPPEAVTPMPDGMSFLDAAVLPLAGNTAWQALVDELCVRPGQRILVWGAGGGVGGFAVQIAAALGAHVTAAVSPARADFIRRLGAQEVVDYSSRELWDRREVFDCILAANGNISLSDYDRLLAPGGKFVCSGGSMRQIFSALLFGGFRRKQGKSFRGSSAKPSHATRVELARLYSAGKLNCMVTSRFTLDEVAKAIEACGASGAGKIGLLVD